MDAPEKEAGRAVVVVAAEDEAGRPDMLAPEDEVGLPEEVAAEDEAGRLGVVALEDEASRLDVVEETEASRPTMLLFTK